MQTLALVGAAALRDGNTAQMAPVAKLFDRGRPLPESVEHPLYQTAWALFALLINEHRAQLARYRWLIGAITRVCAGVRGREIAGRAIANPAGGPGRVEHNGPTPARSQRAGAHLRVAQRTILWP